MSFVWRRLTSLFLPYKLSGILNHSFGNIMLKVLEYTDKSYTPFSLCLSTPHEEPDDAYNILSFAFIKWAWYIKVPQFIKPVGKKVKVTTWDAATIARLGRDWYMDYTPKNYGFTFLEDSIHIAHGIQPGCFISNDKKNSDHVKIWDYPWNYTHVRNTIYTRNGGEYSYGDWHKHDRVKYDIKDRDLAWLSDPTGAYYYFIYRDTFDGMDIPTKAHVSEREWRRGKSKFWRVLLSIFPSSKKVVCSLEIEFKHEVGARKGSWKGGTMAMNMAMLDGESVNDAISRFNTTSAGNKR